MAMIFTGTAVTFDPAQEVVRGAAVYVDDDGLIEVVQPAGRARPAGYTQATVVPTRGLIFPGLIDLHNHLAYNTLPLWLAPRTTPYETRYQWPGGATYGREITSPAEAYGEAAAAAALRYAEVKAVIGGVTSIQGSPTTTRAFPGWMLRNVDKERLPGVGHPWRQSVVTKTREQLKVTAKDLAAGRSFAYHLSEGTADSLRSEFEDLDAMGCVHPQLIGIHSTALTDADFARWGAVGGTVVWSPFSNLWLYGDTTDVLAARRHGLRVCLGNDWAPSATRNLLGELKVADLWNRRSLGGALSDRDLCELVTINPGDALTLAWKVPVGRLVPGALADLCVMERRDADEYRSLVLATERDVRLVVVGGRAAYGLRSLVTATGATGEPISLGRLRRSVVMQLPPELVPAEPDLAADANMSWADGLAALQAVRDDPAGAVRRVRASRPFGQRPLRFEPDMPGPGGVDARRLDDDELDGLVLPPLDGLVHDRAFFDRLDTITPAHARILTELRNAF